MEQRDLELIERFAPSDHVLSELYREHQELEQELEKLDNKSYLSTQEQMQRSEIKKKKLAGRDRIEMILRRYRQEVQNSTK